MRAVVLIGLLVSGCSPSFSLAPGSHYHCEQAMLERQEKLSSRMGEFEGALLRSENYLKNVESLCRQTGGSKQ